MKTQIFIVTFKGIYDSKKVKGEWNYLVKFLEYSQKVW